MTKDNHANRRSFRHLFTWTDAVPSIAFTTSVALAAASIAKQQAVASIASAPLSSSAVMVSSPTTAAAAVGCLVAATVSKWVFSTLFPTRVVLKIRNDDEKKTQKRGFKSASLATKATTAAQKQNPTTVVGYKEIVLENTLSDEALLETLRGGGGNTDGSEKGVNSSRKFTVSVFYPSSIASSSSLLTGQPPSLSFEKEKEDFKRKMKVGAPWLPHPVNISSASSSSPFAVGTALYAKLPPFLFSHWRTVKMNVAKDAPFASKAENNEKLKVIVVSHGLSGHRNVSALLCQYLASARVNKTSDRNEGGCGGGGDNNGATSRPEGNGNESVSKNMGSDDDCGAIVISIGHEDGSGAYAENAKQFYTPPSDSEGEENGWQRRNEQLSYRMGEVKAVVDFVQSGQLERVLSSSSSQQENATAGPTNNNGDGTSSCIERNSLTFVGHSFGGATGLYVLSQALMSSADNKAALSPQASFASAFDKFVLFDAWMCPTNVDSLFGKYNNRERHPSAVPQLMFVETEQWIRWKPNRLKEEKLMAMLAPADQQEDSSVLTARNSHLGNDDHQKTVDEKKVDEMKVSRVDAFGTDHMSPTDMAILLPHLGRKRRQYKETWRGDAEAVISEWASLVRKSQK